MKYILLAFVLVFVIAPTHVFAVCSDTGATAVFVNGILNSRYDADLSKGRLQQAFQEKFGNADVKFITGYNPSHLAGLGDLAQSGAQMLGSSVSDFDLKTILMQIQPEVATRKILLVGHSQGTLYTNSIYDYLVRNGVPKESIAVYNVATPAREVSGGGKYLTSSNDALIRALAALAEKTSLPAPFPPNIDIPIQPGDTESAYPGHNFIRAYLPGASDKIVSDVSRELGALRVERAGRAETCFTAPSSTIGYKIEGALFAVADPTARVAVFATKTVARAEMAAGEFLGRAIAAAGGKIINAATAILAFQDKPQLANKALEANLSHSGTSEEATTPTGTSETGDLAGGPLIPPSAGLRGANPPPRSAPTSEAPVYDQTSSSNQTIPIEIVALSLQSVNPAPFAPGLSSPGFGGGAPTPPSSSTSDLSSEALAEEDVIPNGGENDQNSNDQNEETTEDDNEEATSTPPSLPESDDDDPPDISFSCEGSLEKDGCSFLADAESVELRWSSSAEDLNRFSISCEFDGEECDDFDADLASTTATSTIYALPSAESGYIFKAKAIDNAGNESDEIIKTVEFLNRPVVINEVAWAGSLAEGNDEWIELYNLTSKEISLSGWTLYSKESAKPYIPLSGEIQPYGYFLLERKDDNAASGVAADLIYGNDGPSFSLNNSGEILTLVYGSTTVDETATCSIRRSHKWCSDSLVQPGRPSMERIDPNSAGGDPTNWGTANGLVKNGRDVDGDELVATPRARNSLHYLISQSETLDENRKLEKFFGTYIIPQNQTLTIKEGATLEIEPGVTVKLGGSSSIVVEGTLRAIGTDEDNIIFTALNDPPENGLWENIRIKKESEGSEISFARFEYGGRYFNNTPLAQRAMLSVIENNAPVSNSIFKNSFGVGARLTLADSKVSGNIFSAGTTTSNTGLIVTGGAPLILKNTFSENYTGFHIESESRTRVEDNEFLGNVEDALSSILSAAEFKGNKGSGNGRNGISLIDNIALPGSTTTLFANEFPYLVRETPYFNPRIPAGAGVSVEAGAVWKGENRDSRIDINGTMELKGASKDSIVFTSLTDSGAGLAKAGDWNGIFVGEGGLVYGGGFTLRYGGHGPGCPSCAGFYVLGGRVELREGRIQNNFHAGMQIANSASSSISNFEFLDNLEPGDSTALISIDSTLILSDLIFSNNAKDTDPPDLD